MKTIKLPKVKCGKCGYSWTPRHERLPKVCPECKCSKWQTYKRAD